MFETPEERVNALKAGNFGTDVENAYIAMNSFKLIYLAPRKILKSIMHKHSVTMYMIKNGKCNMVTIPIGVTENAKRLDIL